MRGLLFLLLAATAGAQDTRGFVNPNLVNRNIFTQALKAKAAEMTPVLEYVPAPGPCAIPLLEVVGNQKVDRGMVIVPPTKLKDPMILPAIPVCGKK